MGSMKIEKTRKKRGRKAASTPSHPQFDDVRMIERPDGVYWQTLDGHREKGPFATRLEAEQDLEIVDEETLEVGESLQEAEEEIGMAGWIDPDTGTPAEAELTRLEEH